MEMDFVEKFSKILVVVWWNSEGAGFGFDSPGLSRLKLVSWQIWSLFETHPRRVRKRSDNLIETCNIRYSSHGELTA